MKKYQSPIKGHLDIKSYTKEEEFEGNIEHWNEVLIHGDPEGLRTFAKLLLKLADMDQNLNTEPIGARYHYHLGPNIELAKSSDSVVVGRLDAKGTGKFYDSYIPKEE